MAKKKDQTKTEMMEQLKKATVEKPLLVTNREIDMLCPHVRKLKSSVMQHFVADGKLAIKSAKDIPEIIDSMFNQPTFEEARRNADVKEKSVDFTDKVYIFKQASTGQFIKSLSEALMVFNLYLNLDDYSYSIDIINTRTGISVFNDIAAFSKRQFNQLINYGLYIENHILNNAPTILTDLIGHTDNLLFKHSKIGFDNKLLMFKGINDCILLDEEAVKHMVLYNSIYNKDIVSRYDAPSKKLTGVKTKGDFETFKKGIKELVCGKGSRAELLFAVGLYGIIYQWLEYDGCLNENRSLILNVAADDETQHTSSIGKSILSRLSLILFGKATGSDKLELDFSLTAAKRDVYLRQFSTIPLYIDDMAVIIAGKNTKDVEEILTQYIFSSAAGDTKEKFGSISEHFYSPIISTTEERLIKKISKMQSREGYVRRLIEISGGLGDFTKDENHARELNDFMNNHYGFIDEVMGCVIEYLSNKAEQNKTTINDELRQMFENEQREITQSLRTNNLHIVTAFTDTIAIINMCVKFLNMALDVDMDIQSIDNLIIKSVAYNSIYYSFMRHGFDGETGDKFGIKDNILSNLYHLYNVYYTNTDKVIGLELDTETLSVDDFGNDIIVSRAAYENLVKRRSENEQDIEDVENYYLYGVAAHFKGDDVEDYIKDGKEQLLQKKKQLDIFDRIVGFHGYLNNNTSEEFIIIPKEQDIKRLLGLEKASTEAFRDYCNLLTKLGYMQPGQNRGSHTIKMMINGKRQTYYAISLRGYSDWKKRIKAWDEMNESDDEIQAAAQAAKLREIIGEEA